MSKIFEAFIKQERSIKRIIAKYRSNPSDIEDLAQETFLRGFSAELKNEIHDPDHLLFRIAKNLAINATTKKAVVMSESLEDYEGSPVYIDTTQAGQDDILEARQKLLIVSKALASLPPELRRPLVMRRVDGLKYKQIATRLNVSVSTVERRVAAALADCYTYLKRHGFETADFGKRHLPLVKSNSFTKDDYAVENLNGGQDGLVRDEK